MEKATYKELSNICLHSLVRW